MVLLPLAPRTAFPGSSFVCSGEKMKPLISVVMPVWNGLKAGRGYLQQAVFSLVHQDYEGPIEVIVIDDGSTDGTVEAVQQWAEQIHAGWQSRRIAVVARPHEGVTHSLNAGINRATGEFVARQDADDWSKPTRFTRQVEYLRGNPDVALVGSAVRVVNESRVADEVWYRAEGRIKREVFSKQSPLAHGSVMFRRSALTEVGGYDPQFPHAQDYDLFWRIARLHPIATLPDPLYYYRVHQNRVTSNRRRFQIQFDCAKKIKHRIRRELNQT